MEKSLDTLNTMCSLQVISRTRDVPCKIRNRDVYVGYEEIQYQSTDIC